MSLDFRSSMFIAMGDNQPYQEWFATCDKVSTYQYHEQVLKLLQWKYPPRPWRLKSPARMHSLDALLEVYPEAKFVMTHRDIAQVIPSVVSLLDATSEMLRTPYEEPEAPEVRIDTNVLEPGESAEVILERLRTMGIVPGGPTA